MKCRKHRSERSASTNGANDQNKAPAPPVTDTPVAANNDQIGTSSPRTGVGCRGFSRDNNTKHTVLYFLSIVLLLTFAATGGFLFILLFLVCYGFFIREYLKSETKMFLTSRMMDVRELMAYADTLYASKPNLSITATCYHVESGINVKTSNSTNFWKEKSKQKTKVKTTRDEVVTTRETEVFESVSHRDLNRLDRDEVESHTITQMSIEWEVRGDEATAARLRKKVMQDYRGIDQQLDVAGEYVTRNGAYQASCVY